jgi:hypothetical protein
MPISTIWRATTLPRLLRGKCGKTSSISCRVIKPLRCRFFKKGSLSTWLGMTRSRQVAPSPFIRRFCQGKRSDHYRLIRQAEEFISQAFHFSKETEVF